MALGTSVDVGGLGSAFDTRPTGTGMVVEAAGFPEAENVCWKVRTLPHACDGETRKRYGVVLVAEAFGARLAYDELPLTTVTLPLVGVSVPVTPVAVSSPM